MIITTPRPLQDIFAALDGAERVILIGCGSCATTCETGGEAEVASLAVELDSAGFDIVAKIVPETACHIASVGREIRDADADADVAVVLACGGGVQAVRHATELRVVPGLESIFLGSTERRGVFIEYCAMCGSCLLDRTEGICPHTQCAKGLLNGPCGGVDHGMCEVHPDRRCAWVEIYERATARGRTSSLNETLSPKDWSNHSQRPRKTERTS